MTNYRTIYATQIDRSWLMAKIKEATCNKVFHQNDDIQNCKTRYSVADQYSTTLFGFERYNAARAKKLTPEYFSISAGFKNIYHF